MWGERMMGLMKEFALEAVESADDAIEGITRFVDWEIPGAGVGH